MKKSRIVGYALTLAATLFVGSAMGQANTSTANYVEIKASDANNTRSFITEGEKLSFFAVPDLAFHTAWTAAGVWKLNTGHTWTWTFPNSVGLKLDADGTGSYVKTATGADNDPANFVEITAGTGASALGEQTISVKEGLPAALGGCTGANQTFKLVIFAKPTIAFATGGRDGKKLNAPCSMPDSVIKINIMGTESLNIKFRMKVYSVTVNPMTGVTTDTQVGIDSVFSATKLALAGTIQGGLPATRITWTLAGTAFDYATTTANMARTLTTSATKFITLPGHAITRYQFLIDNTKSDGISDFITRKSTAANIYQAAADQELNFYVKRAPITGPIYHINNNVAK